MRQFLGVLGFALTLSFWDAVARADDLAQGTSTTSPAGPPAASLRTVYFEGVGADVTLGSTRSLTRRAPCEFHVVPGTFTLLIDGRPSPPVIVLDAPVTVVRLKSVSGSPRLLIAGAILLVPAIGLFTLGRWEQGQEAYTCTPGSNFLGTGLVSSCSSNGASFLGGVLEVFGAAVGAAGIVLGTLGLLRMSQSRTVVDGDPPKAATRILPWVNSDGILNAATAGVRFVF